MLDRLDAAAVRRWCAAGLDSLRGHRDEIDALNVYPVPDGDTGTNLVLTMESVAAALATAPGDLAGLLAGVSRAALLGARGNSGVILSQLLRGISDVLGEVEAAGPADLRAALDRAADLAYAAVAKPVEGTVLTVARAAAKAAADAPDDLASVVRAAAAGASEALARTPSQLPALARAGVVDAGGRGLCVLLDALVGVVTGEAPEPPPAAGTLLVARSGLTAARETGSDEFAYEVQYLLDAPSVDALKLRLAELGDSLVVVGGDGVWNVHVHVNDVGAAIEAGVEAGRPHRITVTRFEDQYVPRPSAGRAVVAVAPGPGLVALYEAAGATVVGGGPTANPSTGEILAAVERTGAAEVVVLPNDSNVHGAAGQAAAGAAERGVEVHVVPTRSPVQGLAALAVHDPGRPFTDDAIAMTNAAGATRWAEVTVAVRDAITMAGRCRAGDVLGLVDGDVALVGADVAAVGEELVGRLLASGGELVTAVLGEGAPGGFADRLRAAYPLVEVEVHEGGQPHYPLLLGVE